MGFAATRLTTRIRIIQPSAATPLLDRLDQGRVLGDLSVFFGPRAAAYLRHYERLRDGTGWRRLFPFGWSWSALFLSYAWFFYRKLPVAGALMVLLPIAFGMVSHVAAAATYLGFAAMGKTIYLHRALAALVEADDLRLQGNARLDFLQRAGGISWRAGLIAGALLGATLGLLLFQIATRHH